jgi:hypothetical protein
MRRAVVVVVSALVAVTACSSGDDDAGGSSVAATADGVADPGTDGSGPPTADSGEPATPDVGRSADGTEAGAGDAGTDPVDVELDEWVVEAPTEYPAGPVTFEVANGGTFTHELVVVRGDSYESLPLAANGSVIEEDLPEGALVGRTPRIATGDSETLTVDLEPGAYVFLCNIVAGPSSHAAQGQRLGVRVD